VLENGFLKPLPRVILSKKASIVLVFLFDVSLTLPHCVFIRNRIRMYPAFVNCTTIDWFCEWPSDALLEVADKYLETIEMATVEEVRQPQNWQIANEFPLLYLLPNTNCTRSEIDDFITTRWSSVTL
jgi:hypothetical protein